MGGTGKPPTGDQWIEMDEVDLKSTRGPPPRPPPKPITQVNQGVQDLEGSYKYCFNLIFLLIVIIAVGIAILLIALIPLGNIDTDTDIHVTNEGNTYIRGDGIVASDSEICSRIGLAIMRDKNGNAVDAAVATSFCLGVVNPYSSGIGGGGVMMIHMASRSPSPSATPSVSPTPSQTPSNAPTPSETPSVTPTPDPSNSETPTPSPSTSETPSGTPLATPSNTPSASVLPSPDATPGPSPDPSPDPAPAPVARSLENKPVKSVEEIRREQLSRQRNGRSAAARAARAADPSDWIPAWDTHDILLDYMEVAPAAASADMFSGNSGASKAGGKSVAVPGELRGLYEAWFRWGSGLVAWEELVMPSVDMANDMQVTAEMAVVVKEYENVIRANRKLATIYVQNGTLVQKGDRIQRPDLSATLGAIAVSVNPGDELYVGPFAKQIVEDVVDAGGILTEADLSEYRPRYRTPLTSTYRGNKVISAPPPFSGACLGLGLNILDGFTLTANTTDTVHHILEAFKFMFADRMALGDPDFVENIDYYVSQMLSKEHATDLRLKIQANTTFPPNYYSDLVPISQPATDSGTTHFVIVDPSGNVVSATSSINSPFGSQVLSGGITLNNAMDSFSSSGFSNSDQIPPSENNQIAPKKRPLTSMAPTIIFDPYGGFKLALGASGGSTITTSVLQTVVNVLDFLQELPDAVGASRLHNQLIPEDVLAEKGYSEGILSSLSTMGYPITRIGKDLVEHIGVVQAIQRIDGQYEGVSDIYRKTGMPASYKN